MSVPVVAPLLYDVILLNVSGEKLKSVYVTVMAQEIQSRTGLSKQAV